MRAHSSVRVLEGFEAQDRGDRCAVMAVELPALSRGAATGAAGRILPSKFQPPAAPVGQLLREQLLQAMLSSRSMQLVLACAPAGFGKTTLMQQYRTAAQAAGRGVAWLSIDAAADDLERFVAHLGASLDTMDPALRPGDNSAGAAALVVAPRVSPADAIIERVGFSTRPFVIVLDEFELIQSAEVLNFMRQLLDALPPHGTVAIASRTTPEIGLGRIRARGRLLEIGPGALRFSLDEATTFIREGQRLPLADREIARLHRCTEGWAVALYLATLCLHARSDHAAFVASFSGSNIELAQYLAEDILAHQSDACRAFLLETSVLERLNAPLCNALTGRDDGQQMLDYLDHANIFVFRLDDADGGWYRYHNLFASFLRSRLERLHPGRAQALHHAAAAWHAAHGKPAQAVEHLLDAGDDAGALQQIAACVRDVQRGGGARRLLRWFDRIGAVSLAAQPEVALTFAWALAFYRRFDDAIAVVSAVQQTPGAERPASEAETIRCLMLAMTDRVEECRDATLALIDELGPDQPFQYRVASNTLAFCLVSTYRYDDARRMLSRVLQRDAKERSRISLAVEDALESIIELLQGRLGNALARLQMAAARHRDIPQVTATGGKPTIDVPLALALYESDALDDAYRILAGLLPYTKGCTSNDSLIISHVLMSRLAQLRGDRELSVRTLAELEEVGRMNAGPRVVCSAWLERARVATLERRFDAAEQALRAAELSAQWVRPGVSMHGNDVDTPFIARARLAIARGAQSEVQAGAQPAPQSESLPEALRAAIAEARAVQRHRRALKLRILLVLCLDRVERADEASDELTEALRMASHEGFVRSFIEEGDAIARPLRHWAARHQASAAALGVAPHFVECLLGKLEPAGSPEPGSTVDEPDDQDGCDALSTRELDVLRLMSAGLRNKVIADRISRSEFTVKAHLRNINVKLGAHGRTEALAIARSRGLID